MAYWTRIHPYTRITNFCHAYLELAVDRDTLCDFIGAALRNPKAGDLGVTRRFQEVRELISGSEEAFCVAVVELIDQAQRSSRFDSLTPAALVDSLPKR